MSCLFDSIAVQTGLTARNVCGIITEAHRSYGDHILNGLKLSDWVLYETGQETPAYCSGLERRGWGGLVDIVAASLMLDRPFEIYIFTQGIRENRIIINPGQSLGRPIQLVYTPGHWSTP